MQVQRKIDALVKKGKSKDLDAIGYLTKGRATAREGSFRKGGKVLKPVDKSKNPGLAKLPTKVRNKMGFMKKGGRVKQAKKRYM